MGSGVWALRCGQVFCKGCRTKTTLETVPITKLWFTPSDKAVSKALDPQVAFSHSHCSLSCSSVDAYTDTIRWNCASSKQLFLSHATPRVWGLQAGSLLASLILRTAQGLVQDRAHPNPRTPASVQHTSPLVFLEIQPQNYSISQLQWPCSCTFIQGSFITAIYSYIPHLCSAG